jgi:hypothetical protein
MGIAKTLNALKVPIIAGYLAGFVVTMFSNFIFGFESFTSETTMVFIMALFWPVSIWLAGVANPIISFGTAIFVGVLIWFALKK